MKRILLSFLFVAAMFSLGSCSGLPQGTGGGGGGNANLSLTLSDAPPAGATFLSFNTPITAITLTPSTGTDVSVFSPPTPASFDLIRLQSDSASIGKFQVAAGTYTKINVFVGSPSTIFVNNSSATIGSCAVNTVCSLNSGAPGAISFTFTTPLVLTSGSNVGLGIEFNLNNIVTTTGGIGIDFTQANALSAVTLPRPGQATGTLDSIEDFTGQITASTVTNGNGNITITSATRGTLTGAVSSTTNYNGLSVGTTSACSGNANAQCLGTGKTVSVDATVSTTGVVNISEVDFLDTPAADEIEGIIYPTTTANTFGMVVTDVVNATGNATLNPVGSGTQLTFTLDNNAAFGVDGRNLLVSSTNSSFASQNDLFPGQQVMIHVKTASVTTLLNVVTDRLVLRFSRLTGTVNTVSGNAFTVQNTSAFLGTFNVPPGVLTFPGVTNFDNFSALSDLATGNPTVSFRALYLNPNSAANGQPFMAAKVRKH
ncbi:MAG: DUF4382 domain-containing protein [Acidobacteria bacterium]|nr:DUF4382 domain-containing protein [Acidobacteriota bacterium]MBS1864638.1 DUF4382 domain-containing protein [Acidobacteriota bacterium]